MTTKTYCIKRTTAGSPNKIHYLSCLADWLEEAELAGGFTFEQAIALFKVFSECQNCDYYFSLHTFEEIDVFEIQDED